MMGFFEYCNKIRTQPYNYTRSEAFLVGVESRQAEVDELKSQTIAQGQRFNDQSQKVSDLEFRCDELQKRIDEALMYLRHTDSREHQEKIITKILKGKENEKTNK